MAMKTNMFEIGISLWEHLLRTFDFFGGRRIVIRFSVSLFDVEFLVLHVDLRQVWPAMIRGSTPGCQFHSLNEHKQCNRQMI